MSDFKATHETTRTVSAYDYTNDEDIQLRASVRLMLIGSTDKSAEFRLFDGREITISDVKGVKATK